MTKDYPEGQGPAPKKQQNPGKAIPHVKKMFPVHGINISTHWQHCNQQKY
jgi:hypothetical protein